MRRVLKSTADSPSRTPEKLKVDEQIIQEDQQPKKKSFLQRIEANASIKTIAISIESDSGSPLVNLEFNQISSGFRLIVPYSRLIFQIDSRRGAHCYWPFQFSGKGPYKANVSPSCYFIIQSREIRGLDSNGVLEERRNHYKTDTSHFF